MDSEKIEPNKDLSPTGLEGVFGELIGIQCLKIALFLIFMFIILNSEVFIRRILNKFNGAVDYDNYPTNWGVGIQAMFLALCYIVLNILVSKGFI